jgi:tetratricopeptide (TPR) repeat protein
LPKTVRYKANSVVFFHGDADERIYILKSGRVVLRSFDIETGQEMRDMVQTGEFFGVRSALGRYKREEDALVIADTEVIQFTVAEFEQMVSANTRIIIKMLKVFSTQLRRIHSKVSSMMNQQDAIDPEDGLHQSATFYFQNRQFDHATYIWKRYLELYPEGRHVGEIKKQLSRADHGTGPASDGAASGASASKPGGTAGAVRSKAAVSDAGRVYFEAESVFANDRFDEAIKLFRQVVDRYSDDDEYVLKARFELGRCFFEKGDYAGTIRHYTQLIQEIPRMPQIGEVLFYIGASYGRSGDKAKAKTLLAKARASAGDDAPLRRKIDKLVRELEG